jgi:hypothetical protein
MKHKIGYIVKWSQKDQDPLCMNCFRSEVVLGSIEIRAETITPTYDINHPDGFRCFSCMKFVDPEQTLIKKLTRFIRKESK